MELNGKTLRRIFFGVAGCIFLYWLLHETERFMQMLGVVGGMLSPFIVGAALAFILNVPMRGIEKCLRKIPHKGLRRALAIILTLIAVVLVIYGTFALLIPQLGDTIESIAVRLPEFFTEVQKRVMAYLNENPELLEWVSTYTNFENMDWGALVQNAVTFITDGVGNVVAKAISAVITLGTGIFNGILSLVFALYCLARKEVLARQGRRLLYSFLPEHACDEIIRILRMTNSTFSKFISGQCLEAVILGAMFAITMPIFRMPYVALVSVIIAVTALVPIVGAFAGCIIGAFFILVVDPSQAFWFVILFLTLQQIEGNLIYPRVVGSSVGLPGMWVLMAVGIGGELMGVGGMLLMIPLASVCYALAREITDKRLEARKIPNEKLQDHPITIDWQKVERKRKRKSRNRSSRRNDFLISDGIIQKMRKVIHMTDVVALGELLIDFTCVGTDGDGYPTMAAHPGGAPANFLAALAKFGAKTALIGKVGQDTFGRLLVQTLQQANIDTDGILLDQNVFTTLAFVTLDETGDREFAFARKPGADTMLSFEEVDLHRIDDAKVFHFGTLSLTDEPARTTTQKLANYAKKQGKLLTFDPNLRKPLWKSEAQAKEQILWGLSMADVVKISDEEVAFLFGLEPEAGAQYIREHFPVKLVFVTCGADGCIYCNANAVGHVPGLRGVRVKDTTGAGDIFGGSAVWKLLQWGVEPEKLNEAQMRDIATFACTVAGLSTTRSGGVSSVPDMDAVRSAMPE